MCIKTQHSTQRSTQRNLTEARPAPRGDRPERQRSVNGASTDSDTDGLMLDIITSTYYDLL